MRIDFRKLWQMPAPDIPEKEIDEAYQAFAARIERSSRRDPQRWTRRIGIAAAMVSLIAVGFGSGAAFQSFSPGKSVVWKELSVPYGRTDTLALADGTVLLANAGTTVLYPDAFSGRNREIHFIGEVYLAVAHDPKHPFLVHTQSSVIRVTGTKFNVRSYPRESSISTYLEEGSIQVTLPNLEQSIRMVPGKVLNYDKETGEIALQNIPEHMQPAWHKGEFDAYHKTFRQIADDLERRFNVRIDIDDKALADRMFYASFVNGEEVSRILEAMNMNHEFRVRQKGDSYFVSTY